MSFFNSNMNSRHISTLLIILTILRINGQEPEEEFKCGRRKVQHKGLIINGCRSNEGDWPWHAAIYHLRNFQKISYVCGGSLLNSNSVLTAAHCVSENDETIKPESILVRLGKFKLIVNGANSQEFQAYNIISHPDYSVIDQSNDIAIIRLSTEATFTNFVQPICLWDSNNIALSEVTGKWGTVIGWGITQTDELANTLQYAEIPVISSLTCLKSNRQFFGSFLSDQNFCAGLSSGTGACNGDSGGSLSFERNGVYYIRGIVSLAASRIDNPELCDSKNYVLFTDVAQYLPWIEKIVPQLKPTEPVIKVIPRSVWNAAKPLTTSSIDNFSAKNILIDHSLTDGCSESCSPLIRSFQDYHMIGKKRVDIEYNFLIGGDGDVYEGRGWNRPADEIQFTNDESIVISFIGNYRARKPNEEQLRAGRMLIKDGLRLGKIQSNYGLYGVCQFSDNDSPGYALYNIIRTWPHFEHTKMNLCESSFSFSNKNCKN